MKNKKIGFVEIVVVLITLILFAVFGVVFLLNSSIATKSQQLQRYYYITRLESENIIEIATANIINKLKQDPSTTSFDIFPDQNSDGVLAKIMPVFNFRTTRDDGLQLYSLLKITDSSSKININQDEKAFYTILSNFVKITNDEKLWKLFELKASAKIMSFFGLLNSFGLEQKNSIKAFFTLDSYISDKIVSPSSLSQRNVEHKIDDNVYTLSDLIPKKINLLRKSYVNMNTAKYEVIFSLLNSLSGIYLSKNIGEISESEKDNLLPIGRLKKIEVLTEEAKMVAQKIIDYKKTSSIKSWEEMIKIIKDTNISEEKQELIIANFNPNANLNFFYPPHPLFKRINKIDLINYTNEITFFPTGTFEFEVKVVMMKNNAKLAEDNLYEIRGIFDIAEYMSQSDFAKLRFSSSDSQSPSIETYPFNNDNAGLISFDGYVARAVAKIFPQKDDSTFSFSLNNDLSKLQGQKDITILNVADAKNKTLVKKLKINDLGWDATKTKEGIVLDAKSQYLIILPNIFNAKNVVTSDDKVYCSLSNTLPYKKLNFESNGNLFLWFRNLNDITDRNLITLSNMADVWSNRFGSIALKTSLLNPIVEFGGTDTYKYVFKSQEEIANKDIWSKLKLNWKIMKNNELSNIEFYLNNKKLDIEYFKNIKNLPLTSFFGYSGYKIFSIGLSIGYEEYGSDFPYFFGLFDSLIVTAREIETPDSRYDTKESKVSVKFSSKDTSILFLSSSIYNGNIGVYFDQIPAIPNGGNLFVFPTNIKPTDESSLDFVFGNKVTELKNTEIIDDIYIATIKIRVYSINHNY